MKNSLCILLFSTCFFGCAKKIPSADRSSDVMEVPTESESSSETKENPESNIEEAVEETEVQPAESLQNADGIILGSLDRSLIDKSISEKKNKIKYCYESELQKDLSLKGTIKYKFVISKEGTVSKVDVDSSDMNSPEVEGCISEVLKSVTFPPPKGGGIVIVKYPFLFGSK